MTHRARSIQRAYQAKQLELAREVVPGATRIGLVDDVFFILDIADKRVCAYRILAHSLRDGGCWTEKPIYEA
jgi:hypothetical protein